MAGSVRGYRDAQAPAPVGAQPAEQQRDHQPLETDRRHIADVPREPALAGPETRRPRDQDEAARHP